jgi:two-component system, chemotaxis family, sensor kinase CheA
MSFGEEDEILQDFLVEAGEILDQLSEQLVELEQRPDDRNLLNAIFRGFHTVKGGAGFLQLDHMVECCHITENLFDILRNGKRGVTSELMDVVLQSLDTVNSQFKEVSQRQPLTRAQPELIARLERLVSCQDLTEAPAVKPPSAKVDKVADTEGTRASSEINGLNISDQEFDGFLGAISGGRAPVNADIPALNASAPTATDETDHEITDVEFEALLDQLHGPGHGPGFAPESVGRKEEAAIEPATASIDQAPASALTVNANTNTNTNADSNAIDENEFESLLDQLHGIGKAPKGPDLNLASQAKQQNAELIGDDEFEHLLDQLHGPGRGPTSVLEPLGSGDTAPVGKANGDELAETGRNSPPPRDPAVSQENAGASVSAPAETTVRVDTQRLDDIMNMVGELVLVRNRLVRLGMDSADEALSKAVGNLDVVTADLQTAVMKTRMQPIKKVFGRFPRVVRDLARSLKKEINLDLVGEETDLDKNLVEALADPLVHLVRNSVDHGIELPADREAAGKSRVGKVILAAEQEGDHILLTVSDDGAGMDPVKLREKAVEKGILDPDAALRMSDAETFNLIFAPGFSTKAVISDISGRGVGMDVVKTKIMQLNGSIEIRSKKGEGTRFIIKVPLTLAIMPTLMIMVGRQSFALPLVSVNEIFHMDLTHAHTVDGQECVTIRDKAIPIFHLKRWLVRYPSYDQDLTECHVVIVTVGSQRVGFVVDQLIGQEEVVIKPLGKMLQGTPGMAGATITGDGTIALILDVPSLLKRYVGGL